MQNLLLASTSTVHGSGLLEYLLEELKVHFKGIDEILFIPYARPGGTSHDDYTTNVKEAFKAINKKVVGLHSISNSSEAVLNAKGIFVGGGNTFVLLNQLYRLGLVESLKRVLKSGVPYLGTSAGTNITGQSIGTTNDMPIVYPPSFEALGLIPFNINPHYLDPDPNSKHMGETRETRIKEFHKFNAIPVVGLREGSYLKVQGNLVKLYGELPARIFLRDKEPYENEPLSDLNLE